MWNDSLNVWVDSMSVFTEDLPDVDVERFEVSLTGVGSSALQNVTVLILCR